MKTDALAKYREMVTSGEIESVTRKNPLEKHKDDPKSRAKAIGAKCWDCTGGQREEIRKCPMTDCPLYGFRPYK